MLTISQLATYTGVTVRAVRHYHQVGLLAEPARDHSGYRRYAAADVVRLIRIRTLADAGVPLARVQRLLDAESDDFAAGVDEIDTEIRAEIRRLQTTRTRLTELAAGERVGLPDSVVGYLDRLRSLGVDERYVVMERDAWIMIAAQMPDRIDAIIADKHEALNDPDTERLYRLLGQSVDWPLDHPGLVEIADIMERQLIAAAAAGESGELGVDDALVDLMDGASVSASPVAQRLVELLEERGWRGWMRLERLPGHESTTEQEMN